MRGLVVARTERFVSTLSPPIATRFSDRETGGACFTRIHLLRGRTNNGRGVSFRSGAAAPSSPFASAARRVARYESRYLQAREIRISLRCMRDLWNLICAPVTPPTQIERTLYAIEEMKGAEIKGYNK